MPNPGEPLCAIYLYELGPIVLGQVTLPTGETTDTAALTPTQRAQLLSVINHILDVSAAADEAAARPRLRLVKGHEP